MNDTQTITVGAGMDSAIEPGDVIQIHGRDGPRLARVTAINNATTFTIKPLTWWQRWLHHIRAQLRNAWRYLTDRERRDYLRELKRNARQK